MKMATKQSNIPHTTSWTQSVSNSSCVKRKDAKDQSTQKITFSIYTVLAWYKLTKWPFNRGANNIQAILILCDGAISHNWPQITSHRTFWGKSHNS